MEKTTAMGTSMIVVGLALVFGGVLVVTRKPPESAVGVAALPELSPSLPAPATLSRGPTPVPTADSAGLPTPSQEKGERFEKWVVKKFSPAFFKLKEWRGDKYVDGIHAESSEHPDLEMEFRMKGVTSTFAIECKWRRSFDRGAKPGIEWATEKQIANYQKFQQDRGIPVFVVIGIGGSPDDPEALHIVSLDRLRYPFATAEYLAKFRRTNPGSDFYYDSKMLELR